MSPSINNTQQLKDFISEFKLTDNHSRVFFYADIVITTASSELVIHDRIHVTFAGYDNYGQLSIMEANNTIDTKLFPFVFDAKWQSFNFVNNEYLQITGNHLKNPVIGKYQVIIRPKT